MVTGLPASIRLEYYTKNPINGQGLRTLVEAGLAWLRTNQQVVNALNVFPVPDGDTGTNMVLTMQAAYDEIANSPEHNVGKMAHAVAHGALMGARGNSGVILSQLWRGFARALDTQSVMEAPDIARAFGMARDTAYKGVVRPVEGTILTVAKEVALAAEQGASANLDPVALLEMIVKAADASVQNTPELLPVLKEAGVVDSGGKGLFYILEGMLRFIHSQPLDTAVQIVQPISAMQLEETLESIEPGQDYEWVLDFRPHASLDLVDFYENLEQMGTSIQVGEGDGMYRLHIHVPQDKVDEPPRFIRSMGTLLKATIENLMAQMENIDTRCTEGVKLAAVDPEHIAVVAVAPGVGIARVFASLGAAAIVEGGQTMNPSTQEIINAFENLPAQKIIILPNNKNIILAANTAVELTGTRKKVAVVPSRSVPQGLTALMRLIPEGDFDSVVEEMNAALDEVETGEITTATRSVAIDDVDVVEGQVIVLHNGRLVLAAANLEEALLGFMQHAHADHFEIATLFWGANLNRREADRLADLLRRTYPKLELEVEEGCQPHYQFIIALE
jgi:hypothetical protein